MELLFYTTMAYTTADLHENRVIIALLKEQICSNNNTIAIHEVSFPREFLATFFMNINKVMCSVTGSDAKITRVGGINARENNYNYCPTTVTNLKNSVHSSLL